MARVPLSLLVAALSLLALSLVPSALASTSLACPSFTCPPAYPWKDTGLNSNWYYGKFIDPNGPSDDERDDYDIFGKGGVLKYFFLNSDDFADTYGWEPDTSNPQLECAKVCQDVFNLQYITSSQLDGDSNPWYGFPESYYYQLEITCTSAFDGTCQCMASKVCDGNSPGYWSDEGLEPAEAYDPHPAGQYYTGKVCPIHIVGDPHFSGADGSNFEFSGVPNKAFALISDAHVQVNGFFGGRYGEWDGRTKAMTWVRSLGIMWGHHTAVFSARTGASAEYGSGYMSSILVDGAPLDVSPNAHVSAADSSITVSWVKVGEHEGMGLVDEYKVQVGDFLTLRLVLRPEIAALRTPSDGVVHISINIDDAHLSTHAHGVIGQTYRPDFVGRLSQQHLVFSKSLQKYVVPGDNAEGFLYGSVEDYQVKDLLKADCNLCLFARESHVDEETASALANVGASGTSVSRRLLSLSL